MFAFNCNTAIFILQICIYYLRQIYCNDCVLHIDDLNNCAKLVGIKRIPEKYEGFGFGFGSVSDVEHMCRTRWHIKVYSCAQLTILGRCSSESKSHFRDVMWRFIFDTTPYEKAANYLCQPYNLRIFRHHRDNCLFLYESQVEKCSKDYSNLLSKTHLQLANSNPVNSRNADEYANYMKSVLSATYCSGTLAKVDCIKSILSGHCANDIIELIQNYFRETLPSGCEKTVRSVGYLKKQNVTNETDSSADMIMNDFQIAYIKSYTGEDFDRTNQHFNRADVIPSEIQKTTETHTNESVKNSSILAVQKVSSHEKNDCVKLSFHGTLFVSILTTKLVAYTLSVLQSF
ncbi:unnamed protein product [Trichobilharzia szidati]|nr:unnamed protein product [Trichobilharzia szidati]